MPSCQSKWMQYIYILPILLRECVAQTPSSPIQLYDPREFTGISKGCREALGANVNCPPTLFNLQLHRGTDILSGDITDLCQKSCADSIDHSLSGVSNSSSTAMSHDLPNNYRTPY